MDAFDRARKTPTYVPLNDKTADDYDVMWSALRELQKAVSGTDLLTAARQAVARIDRDGDVIYCLKQRLAKYEEVE